VKLRLAAEGLWVLSAVEMTAAAPDSGADWESFWASLSLEITPAEGTR
jgi:hypothetical protein